MGKRSFIAVRLDVTEKICHNFKAKGHGYMNSALPPGFVLARNLCFRDPNITCFVQCRLVVPRFLKHI